MGSKGKCLHSGVLCGAIIWGMQGESREEPGYQEGHKGPCAPLSFVVGYTWT